MPAIGINHGVIDEQRAPGRERRVGLGDQLAPLRFAVAVQQVAEAEHVRSGQRTVIHVARDESGHRISRAQITVPHSR